MISNRETQDIISWLLTIGTIISALFVCIGGLLHLYQHGSLPMQTLFLSSKTEFNSFNDIFLAIKSFSPYGLIEIGILLIIATQILRVGLLVWFYASIKDVWFFLISLFVFTIMLISLFIKK